MAKNKKAKKNSNTKNNNTKNSSKKGNNMKDLFENLNEQITEEELIQRDKGGSRINGAHKIKIVQCPLGTSKNGAGYVDLTVNIDDNRNNDDELKEYNLERMYITSREGKLTRGWGDMFLTIFKIYELSFETKKLPAITYDFEEKTNVKKKIKQYKDLINKTIGGVIEMKLVYKNKPYDAQEGTDITYEEIDYNNPYHIWIPNYDKDPQPEFHLQRVFNHKSKQTLSEMKEDKEPTKILKLHNRLKNKEVEPIILTDTQMYEYIEKEVERNCKNINMEFDADVLAPYGKVKLESKDEVPF